MSETQRFQLETLNEQHPILSFFCEDEDINNYLHTEALPDMEKGVARTFVEVDNEKPATHNVAGFFTLRAHALRIDENYFDDWMDTVEEDKTSLLSVEVPLVELMWLARDLQWRGAGMGDTLMIDALQITAQAADCIGFIGLHLRSTPRGVLLYENYDFQPFKEHPTFDRYRYILPIHTLRGLVSNL